jgi:hypothetical protein
VKAGLQRAISIAVPSDTRESRDHAVRPM